MNESTSTCECTVEAPGRIGHFVIVQLTIAFYVIKASDCTNLWFNDITQVMFFLPVQCIFCILGQFCHYFVSFFHHYYLVTKKLITDVFHLCTCFIHVYNFKSYTYPYYVTTINK